MVHKNLIVALCLWFSVSSPAWAEPAPIDSTVNDQKSIDLTIYNDNYALVREVRRLNLPQGHQLVRMSDVPRHISAETIQVRSLSAPSELSILEQNYTGQTLSAASLLDQYVGKKIKVLNWNQYQDRKETSEALLLSNEGEPIYQIGGEIYIGYPGFKILPELPAGMLARPALIWRLENKSKKPHDVEVIYLTSNLSWKADYVLTLPEGSGAAQFGAWAALTNTSGTFFKNAALRLMAGQVNRQAGMEYAPRAMMTRAAMAVNVAASQNFQEQGMFEYHVYDLGRRVDLANAETKQLPLFQDRALKFAKEFRAEGAPLYYAADETGEKQKLPVRVMIKFKNDKDSGLGIPLPQGAVRFYMRDAQGRPAFLGEDSLRHTPHGEEVRLQAGEVFDLTAERRQTDFRQVTSNTNESEWEIRLRNSKKEDAVIKLVENLQGNWQMLSQSQNFEKISASAIQFTVKVAQNSEVVVRYRVLTGF
ncbi:MAG: DUF4139 domain-containing protein [Candidatus Omnitrophica bacterium]|nr:DUF4139 domain-containing protein [Candidatus Omnitrophota bacterium]